MSVASIQQLMNTILQVIYSGYAVSFHHCFHCSYL